MSTTAIVTVCISAAALLISFFLAINTYRLFKRSEVSKNESVKKDLYDSVRRYREYTIKKTEDNGKKQMNLTQAIEVIRKSYKVGYEEPNPSELKPAHKLINEMYDRFLFDVQTADCVKMDNGGRGFKYDVDINARSVVDKRPINYFLDKTRDSLAIMRDIANFAKEDGKIKGNAKKDLLWIINVVNRIDPKAKGKKEIEARNKEAGQEIIKYFEEAFDYIRKIERHFSDAITNAKNTVDFNNDVNDSTIKSNSFIKLQNDFANEVTKLVKSREIKWHPNAIGKEISKIVNTYDEKRINDFNSLKNEKSKLVRIEKIIKLSEESKDLEKAKKGAI